MQSLWELDQSLFRAIHVGWRQGWLDPVFWVISATGLGSVQLLFVAFSFFFVKPGPDRGYGKHFLRVAAPLILVWALSGLIATVWLKHAIDRDRPSVLHDSNAFEAIGVVPRLSSFPSGHAATAFGIATVIWFLLCGYRKALLGPLIFAWATAVGVSRIYLGVHWPTDVLAGAAIGVFAGCAVILLFGPMIRERGTKSDEPIGQPDPSAPGPDSALGSEGPAAAARDEE